jgi:undecaprenyl-diphosphatase
MDPLVQALVMGVVQGLTEFLPISSSGHLILVPWLLGWDQPFITSLAFSVMLHMGTLAALLAYFARDWVRLVGAGLASLRDRRIGDDPTRRLAWVLVVATVPAGLAGVLLGDAIESVARRPAIVALALVVGAAILWYADEVGRHERDADSIGWGAAFAIGIAQAIALVPGISRSGITISAGLLLGITREAAARFSFLLAAPTIAGAGLFEVYRLVRGEAGAVPDTAILVVGVLASLVTGVLTIHALLGWFRRRGVGVFVAYRIALAALVVVALLKV